MTENEEGSKNPGRISEAIDATNQLLRAVPVYQDSIQPAAKEIGKTLETAAKTVNIALAPLESLVWFHEKIKNFLTEKLATKFQNIPEEKIVTPPTNIAVPAIEALRYAGYNELREMYASLIASSMNLDTCQFAHPAFVEILKQLSPHEAKFIQEFDSSQKALLYQATVIDETGQVSYPDFYVPIIRDHKISFVLLTGSSIVNLTRLGLFEIETLDHDLYLTHKLSYERWESNKKTVEDEILKIYLEESDLPRLLKDPKGKLKSTNERLQSSKMYYNFIKSVGVI